MKQNRLLTLTLTLLVVLSILLTYYLLYDFTSFKEIFSRDASPSNEEITVKNRENQLSNFYKPTQVELTSAFDPLKIIYRNDETTEWVMETKYYNAILDLVKTNHAIVDNPEIIEDAKAIENLYVLNHLQFSFINPSPVALLSDFVTVNGEIDNNFLVDRLIILLNNPNQVYLIDTVENKYILGQLSKGLSDDQVKRTLKDANTISVQGYLGRSTMIYLPNEPVQMQSQVFTLETLPENLFLSSFFSDSNFSISEGDPEDRTVSYFNYQYTLEFSNNKQWLNIRISRPQEGTIKNIYDKIQRSYESIRNYEYWKGSLRYMSPKTNYAIFRRFIDGFPIFPQPGEVDFGAAKVHLRNSPNADIFRLQIPLVIFQAQIQDMSARTQLESADEVFAILDNNGFEFQYFSDAFIGYEWQRDNETNKKATLIPKWYFQFENNYYSIDQIQGDNFKDIWETALNPGGDS